MAPNSSLVTESRSNSNHLKNRNVSNGSSIISEETSTPTIPPKDNYKLEIAWLNVAVFIYLHAAAVYGLFVEKKVSTVVFSMLYGFIGSFGISAGAHRYFCHKTFKANLKLKYFLVFLQTVALQNSVLEWVRDHRVHHKFADTNADPHNASRGFFFSHVGWLLCKKHPDVKTKGATVDMSDLSSDPLLKFQHKFYAPLVTLLSFGLPVFICCHFFNESVVSALNFNLFRYVLTLHITWSINSVSHIWGNKPFEKGIKSTDTYIIGILALGEGWHNFHHVFPWDYKVSELPRYWCNYTLPFIDFFAWLGWATDLKTVSDEMVKKRVLRTGDGTHRYSNETAIEENNNNNDERDVEHFWGFGDKDMLLEDIQGIEILHQKYGV